MKRWHLIGLGILLVFACACWSQTPRHVTPASLDKNTRELFDDAMALDEHFYDDNAHLVHSPNTAPGHNTNVASRYMVRESSGYALGLLLRDNPGDRQRAAGIIDAVLKEQYLKPGVKWFGTYKRTPEEPDPTPDHSVIWRAYDPNWRVFIGTTWAMILIEYPDRIPKELASRMYEAIDRSLEGEIAEARLVPTYTNIALMYGFQWEFAAMHDNRADWKQKASEWNEAVYREYKKHDTFFEYNSPTYCGVDLYGLALWRDYGSERVRSMGSEMEAGLWRDLMSYYNAGLRNISGPYDRSYGMDMENYVSVVGVWMRSVLDANVAPLPKITPTTDHVADVWFAPHIAILGTRIPADAMAEIKTFKGDHLVHKQITEERSATAWIGKDVIFGGEATSKTKDAGPSSQFHPATIQWRTPSGEIGWVQLVECPMVDATADQHGLTISTTGDVRLRIHANGMTQNKVTAKDWTLPGLHVAVSSDAKDMKLEPAHPGVDVVYSGITRMRLEIAATH